jgi:hypothetical protein
VGVTAVNATVYPEQHSNAYIRASLALWRFAKNAYMWLFSTDTTVVVGGGRDAWLQRCSDALNANARFSIESVSEDDYQLKAKYHRPPVWATMTVTLVPEGSDSTRINASVTVLPNGFTLIFGPGKRVLARFTRALGE